MDFISILRFSFSLLFAMSEMKVIVFSFQDLFLHTDFTSYFIKLSCCCWFILGLCLYFIQLLDSIYNFPRSVVRSSSWSSMFGKEIRGMEFMRESNSLYVICEAVLPFVFIKVSSITFFSSCILIIISYQLEQLLRDGSGFSYPNSPPRSDMSLNAMF